MRQSGNDEKANEKFVRRMMQMALIRRMFGEDGYSEADNGLPGVLAGDADY